MKKSELRQIIKEELYEVKSEDKWNKMSTSRRKQFLIKHSFSSKYNDYEFKNLTKTIKDLLKENIDLDDIPENKLLSIASKSKNSTDFIKKLKGGGFKPRVEKDFIEWYEDNMED